MGFYILPDLYYEKGYTLCQISLKCGEHLAQTNKQIMSGLILDMNFLHLV